MKPRTILLPILLLALAHPAWAVVNLPNPLSKIYDTASAVVVAKVTKLDPDRKVVDLAVVDTAKGESPGATLRIQVAVPTDLFAQLAADQPLVIFAGMPRHPAVVHLADTWLLAERVGDLTPQAWRVLGVHTAEKNGFPGRTATLVRIIELTKAGKYPLLDGMEVNYFGGVRKLGKLPLAGAEFLLAADLTGSRRMDLVVGAGGKATVLAAGENYQDFPPKWSAEWPAGGYRAIGDANGDGRTDILLGNKLHLNQGGGAFVVGATFDVGPAKPLAAALIDAAGNGKPDAVFLTQTGELRVFTNPGAPDKPWPAQPVRALWKDEPPAAAAAFGDFGDTAKPCVLVVRESGIWRYELDGPPRPADFERLTGETLRNYVAYRDGLKNATAVALDINGDGRLDLLVHCDTGGILLVNRGYGAFLVDGKAGTAFQATEKNPVPFKLSAATPWTAADLHGDKRHDLLILAEDGQLFEMPCLRQGPKQ